MILNSIFRYSALLPGLLNMSIYCDYSCGDNYLARLVPARLANAASLQRVIFLRNCASQEYHA